MSTRATRQGIALVALLWGLALLIAACAAPASAQGWAAHDTSKARVSVDFLRALDADNAQRAQMGERVNPALRGVVADSLDAVLARLAVAITAITAERENLRTDNASLSAALAQAERANATAREEGIAEGRATERTALAVTLQGILNALGAAGGPAVPPSQ